MNKYRALFIGHKIGKPTADFQSVIEDEWAETLALHCDLHIINTDFDYAEVCDKINPDFVVLRNPGGYRSQPVQIKNAHARPDIPKIGMYVDDPHDTSRVTFLRLLDELGVERFFVPGTATFRQSPELAARTFTMGLFIDDAVFCDYDLEKLIPVSIFGGLAVPNFYAWRTETAQHIADHFPTLVYTHPGYSNPVPRYHFPVIGADYAKMLNRSWFSLADPTREAYVVRKHLEIPAAGAILIAPDFPELACYGFRDMQNCVLGSGTKLFGKIAAVANDPALYGQIRIAGQQLVHARHSRKTWRWIIDWYDCQKSLRPGESVQQQGILGPFNAVPHGAPSLSAQPLADSDFTIAMKRALHLILHDRNLDEAESILRNVASWLGHLNEPYVPLALIELLRGRPQRAKDWLLTSHAIRTRREGATCFDPEELAWLWITAEILGDQNLLNLATTNAAGIEHLSLRRARAVCTPRTPEQGPLQLTPELLNRTNRDRPSIHWTGQLEWSVWLDLVSRITSANQKLTAA
jgi:hypothetical protein